MKIPYNMLLVKGRDGVSNARLLGELSESTSSELAAISTVDKLLESTLTLFETYFSTGKILILIFAVFSVIGMIDTVYESSRSRREEFGLYTIAGMNKKRLFAMKLLEVTLAIGIGLAIGILASVAMSFISNAGLSSKTVEIFIGVKEILR
jgi:ABC-type antimicrobial peptide transport system permease subunit